MEKKEQPRVGARLAVVTAFAFVFMMGFALSSSMYSTILPRAIGDFSVELGQAAYASVFSDIGQVGAMLAALLVLDRLNKVRGLGASALCYGVALLLCGTAPVFMVLLLTRLAIGFFGGLLDNLCATCIADLYGEQRTRVISVLHTLFALGSMAGPPVAAYFVTAHSWRSAYVATGLVVAGLAAVFLLLFLLVKQPQPLYSVPQKKQARKIPYRQILKNHNMRWLCVGSALLAGVYYVTNWLPTYLAWVDDSLYSVSFCAMLMTVNYVGMIASRALLALLAKWLPSSVYLTWSSLISAACLAGMLLLNRIPAVWVVGMFILGCTSGAHYTAKFVLACGEFPEYSATATAIVGVCGSAGSMFFSAVVGAIAGAGHYTAAMFIPAAALVGAFCAFHFGYGRAGAKAA